MIEAFGRFQLLRRLGSGAYGEVYWAYDPQLDRDVAIKRPHRRRLPPELAERFAREARSAAQLQHRHIVGTYEVGEVDGRPYIASEYMSPEQWQDSHAVDRRTDLWAVGVILFELLTGERPFRAERDQKLLMQQILNADPPPPSQLNSQVPADLDTLCLKCLEKDPSRRFPTAAALAQELHRFLHGEPIHSRPITQWERARKWCQRNPAVASF